MFYTCIYIYIYYPYNIYIYIYRAEIVAQTLPEERMRVVTMYLNGNQL